MIGFLKQKIKRDKFRRKWRNKNSHNMTIPINIFDINKIEIGKATYGSVEVLSWGHHDEKLYIGNYCAIANGVKFILGGNHFSNFLSNYPFSFYFQGSTQHAPTNGPIIIQDGVWIGTDALILSGVSIGKGAIIGARAVVTKDIPPFAIVVGNPGKVIKYRFNEETRKRLLKIHYYDLIDNDFYKKYQELIDKPLNEELINILENFFPNT